MRHLNGGEIASTGFAVALLTGALTTVIIVLQALGYSASWFTLVFVILLNVAVLLWFVVISYVLFFWRWYRFPYFVVPLLFYCCMWVTNAVAVGSTFAYIGYYNPGSITHVVKPQPDVLDYYLFGIDVSTTSGYGYLVPISNMARVFWAVKVSWYSVFWVFISVYVAIPVSAIVKTIQTEVMPLFHHFRLHQLR